MRHLNLTPWTLEDALSMAAGWIHSYEFPSDGPETISLRLITAGHELIFPLLLSRGSASVAPGSGSQGDPGTDRKRKFLFHGNLRAEVTR